MREMTNPTGNLPFHFGRGLLMDLRSSTIRFGPPNCRRVSGQIERGSGVGSEIRTRRVLRTGDAVHVFCLAVLVFSRNNYHCAQKMDAKVLLIFCCFWAEATGKSPGCRFKGGGVLHPQVNVWRGGIRSDRKQTIQLAPSCGRRTVSEIPNFPPRVRRK